MAECGSRSPRMQRAKEKAMLQESFGLGVEETSLYGNQWLSAQGKGVYGRESYDSDFTAEPLGLSSQASHSDYGLGIGVRN